MFCSSFPWPVKVAHLDGGVPQTKPLLLSHSLSYARATQCWNTSATWDWRACCLAPWPLVLLENWIRFLRNSVHNRNTVQRSSNAAILLFTWISFNSRIKIFNLNCFITTPNFLPSTVEVAYNESPGTFKSDSLYLEFVQSVTPVITIFFGCFVITDASSLSLTHTHTYTYARAIARKCARIHRRW